MRLYEIDKALLDVIEDAYSIDEDTGEILFDVTDIERLEIDRQTKLEACALYLKDMQAEAAAMRAERDKLDKRLRAKQRAADSMSSYILSSMLRFGGKPIETARVAIRTRKSKAVEIFDASALTPEYVRRTVSVAPDKTAIRKALSAGVEVPGAAMVEHISLALK